MGHYVLFWRFTKLLPVESSVIGFWILGGLYDIILHLIWFLSTGVSVLKYIEALGLWTSVKLSQWADMISGCGFRKYRCKFGSQKTHRPAYWVGRCLCRDLWRCSEGRPLPFAAFVVCVCSRLDVFCCLRIFLLWIVLGFLHIYWCLLALCFLIPVDSCSNMV